MRLWRKGQLVRDVSILVLGTGFWGSEWLRAISSVDGVNVAGTAGQVSTVPEGVELAPGYRHYGDYKTAIDESDADAVLVVLPIALHTDAVLRAVESGRHVICEKPVAPTAADVARILASAEAHPDQVVMVNQNYRWRSWARSVRAKIADGTVGTVAHVNVRFSQRELLAGGRGDLDNPLLQDMSIHHFDLLRYLTGKNAVEIFARAHRPPWSDYAGAPGLDALITMVDGIRVNYSGSWAGRGPATTWDGDWSIQGELGLLSVVDGRVAFYPDSREGRLAPEGHSTAQPLLMPIPEQQPRDDLQSSLGDFRQAIHLGRSPETGIEDNCHSIAMVYAAEESIRSDRPVLVETWSR